jgi:hypothetical protein
VSALLKSHDPASDVFHGVLKEATYEETIKALDDHFGDQHLATAYHIQLKTRAQGVSESLQDFATTVEQLAHSAYTALPKDNVRREAGRAFADRVEDPDTNI